MPKLEQFNDYKESIMKSRKLYTFSHNGEIKGSFLAYSPHSLNWHLSLCCC